LTKATEENRRTLSYFIRNHYSKAEDAFDEAADFLVTVLGRFNKVGTLIREDGTDFSSFEATKLLSSQLSRIDLPKFSGEFSEWKSFRNTFGTLVGSNDENTLKLYYLKSCVSDAAAKLINDLSMSDDDYPLVWKILMNEHEDKRPLIQSASRIVRLFSINEIREPRRTKEVETRVPR